MELPPGRTAALSIAPMIVASGFSQAAGKVVRAAGAGAAHSSPRNIKYFSKNVTIERLPWASACLA